MHSNSSKSINKHTLRWPFCLPFCFSTFLIVAQSCVIHQMKDNFMLHNNGVILFFCKTTPNGRKEPKTKNMAAILKNGRYLQTGILKTWGLGRFTLRDWYTITTPSGIFPARSQIFFSFPTPLIIIFAFC